MRLFPRNFRRLGYIYLLQLIIPMFYLSFLPTWQYVCLGAFLIFLLGVCYVLSWWASYRQFVVLAYLEIILMLVMGAVLSLGFLSVLFWPAAAIARFRRRFEQILGVGVLIGSGLAEIFIVAHLLHASLAPWRPMIFAGVAAVLFTMIMVRWQTEMYQSRTALKNANLEIERLSKLAERDRISQDLHDVLGHELAMITLKAQLADRLVTKDTDGARNELHDIQESARRTLTRVREYIAQMRSPSLEEEWNAATRLLSAADVEVITAGTVTDIPVANACSQALAMSLREAATNIVKHSHATQAALAVVWTNDNIVLTVSDNGRGISRFETQGQGHGLSGLTARLSAVNGKLGLWSQQQWLSHWQPISIAEEACEQYTTVVVLEVPATLAERQDEVWS